MVERDAYRVGLLKRISACAGGVRTGEPEPLSTCVLDALPAGAAKIEEFMEVLRYEKSLAGPSRAELAEEARDGR